MKNKMTRLASKITAASMVLSMFAAVFPAGAAEMTGREAIFSSLKASTATNVQFNMTSAQDFVDTNTLTITWPAGFTISAVSAGDVLMTGSVTSLFSVDATCDIDVDYSFAVAGQVMTFTDCSGEDEIADEEEISIYINNLAVVNATSAEYTISLGGSVSGDMQVYIVDDDQVSVTADIDPTMTFDLDVATSSSETGAEYEIDFGDIDHGTPEASDNSSYKSVWIDLETNASGGAVVTVKSLNAAMKSTSTGDQWVSSTNALSTTAERYGICVDGTINGTLRDSATFTAQSPYNTGALCDGTTNTSVGALQQTSQSLLSATGPLESGRAQVRVGMSVASDTPAHPDYTDTLTFLATATY
ncbi:hypothetical protein JW899_00445 [Candidatus Uhrbacteria bacterium]|nr:hypothetical protein [Candidatus Uhrbacteria bacterium]